MDNVISSEKELVLKAWSEKLSEYESVRCHLRTLPYSLSYDVMINFGKVGFMPGRLVKTNQVTVLLGDNWFVKCSTFQATKIIGRRIKQVGSVVQVLEKELGMCRTKTLEEQALMPDAEELEETEENFPSVTAQNWKEREQNVERKPKPKIVQFNLPKLKVEEGCCPKGVNQAEFDLLLKRLDDLEELDSDDSDSDIAPEICQENVKKVHWSDSPSQVQGSSKPIVNECPEYSSAPSSILKNREENSPVASFAAASQPSEEANVKIVPGSNDVFTGVIKERLLESSEVENPALLSSRKPLSKFRQRRN